MKKLVVILLATISMVACTKAPSLVITADGNAEAEGYAYLSVLGSNEIIDSVLIENGCFRMELRDLNPNEVYNLSIPSIRMREYIFAETGELHLDMSTDHLTGTPLAQELSEFLMMLEEQETFDAYDLMMKEAYAEHKEDLMGAVILYYMGYDMQAEDALALYESASELVKNTAFMKQEAETWRIQVNSSVGHPFIDIEVPYEGKIQRLSDYVGNGRKLTIVDFWASWCRPCREEIPYLKEVYERYKDQGVEVVGVATWDEPEATLKAIEALGISYPQIINAQRIGSDAYGIQGIPEILLIDADGTILARGLRGAEIEEAIIENLN